MIPYMNIIRSSWVLIFAVVALSGCAAQAATLSVAEPAHSSTPAAAPTPTPKATSSATQARETGLEAPQQVFGGECASLFSDEELSAALGAPMSVNTNVERDLGHYPDPIQSTVEQIGGIQCSWSSPTKSGIWLWVFVFPLGAIDYDEKAYGCVVTGFEGNDCQIESVSAGVRISGILGDSNGASTAAGLKKSTSRHAAFVALFEERVGSVPLTPAPIPALGAWNVRPDCEAVVAAGDVTKVPGLGAKAKGRTTGFVGGYLPGFLRSLHGDAATGCSIDGESVDVDFTALGGERWKGAASVEKGKAKPLQVDGLDAVYVRDNSNGTHTIDVLDGPNWLQFDVKFTKNAGPIARALVAGLDATAER
jgi:hypothetical protein